jgi:hypothetical protein
MAMTVHVLGSASKTGTVPDTAVITLAENVPAGSAILVLFSVATHAANADVRFALTDDAGNWPGTPQTSPTFKEKDNCSPLSISDEITFTMDEVGALGGDPAGQYALLAVALAIEGADPVLDSSTGFINGSYDGGSDILTIDLPGPPHWMGQVTPAVFGGGGWQHAFTETGNPDPQVIVHATWTRSNFVPGPGGTLTVTTPGWTELFDDTLLGTIDPNNIWRGLYSGTMVSAEEATFRRPMLLGGIGRRGIVRY